MSIISNVLYSPNIINIGGDVAIILLTILLGLSFLINETRYYNVFTSNIIEYNSKILLLIFIAVVLFKILTIILELNE